MRILSLRTFAGPSTFHNSPTLQMTLDLEDLKDTASTDIPGFNERIKAAFPNMIEHRCSPGHRGGFFERLDRGTYFAHIIEHIALELSEPAGITVGYGKSVYAGSEGVYKIVVRYECEKGMRFLLEQSVEIAQKLASGSPLDLDATILEAKRIISRAKLGPSTQAIVKAAEEQNIPWKRLNSHNLIQFGFGKHRKFIQATTTCATGDIAVDIVQDKDFTKSILSRMGIPVPKGVVVSDLAEATDSFYELGQHVVVKPADGNHGNGVTLGVDTLEKLALAVSEASKFSSEIILEEQFHGHDFRLVVINGKLEAASRRVPAHVIGDGQSTVLELVERENRNPLRGEGHEMPLTKLELDEHALIHLSRSGITTSTVPAAGQSVFLRDTANLSTGGSAIDVTDEVHPDTKLLCERAARAVGLNICGIDFIVSDIRKSFREQKACGIIELNAGPGIRMHHYPAFGKPRNVGKAIVKMMYPQESSGRIPIVAISGTNGKTTVTRMVAHGFREAGNMVGHTSSDGIYVDNQLIEAGDTTGPYSAGMILDDPSVEIAVLETARGGILKRGLGFDWCDVAVITNVQPDHLGQDGIETLDDLLKIKMLIAERVREGGTIVLNADDAKLASLPDHRAIAKIKRNIVFFGRSSDHVVIRKHILAGGTAYFEKNGFLVESKQGVETAIAKLDEIPLTLNGTASYQVLNAMATAAALRAQNLSVGAVQKALGSFSPSLHNPGRANLFNLEGRKIVLDYGHNPDAFRQVAMAATKWDAKKITAVLALPGDRNDEVIRMAAREVGAGFSKIILREDSDLRGREIGAVPALVQVEIAANFPAKEVKIELDEKRALELAIEDSEEGEIIVFFYDNLPLALETLKIRGAVATDLIAIERSAELALGVG
jgi:cyanophycin synthetase